MYVYIYIYTHINIHAHMNIYIYICIRCPRSGTSTSAPGRRNPDAVVFHVLKLFGLLILYCVLLVLLLASFLCLFAGEVLRQGGDVPLVEVADGEVPARLVLRRLLLLISISINSNSSSNNSNNNNNNNNNTQNENQLTIHNKQTT